MVRKFFIPFLELQPSMIMRIQIVTLIGTYRSRLYLILCSRHILLYFLFTFGQWCIQKLFQFIKCKALPPKTFFLSSLDCQEIFLRTFFRVHTYIHSQKNVAKKSSCITIILHTKIFCNLIIQNLMRCTKYQICMEYHFHFQYLCNVVCISTFISYFLFLLYLISTDLTSIYSRSRTTTLQTPINVLYWKRFSNSFYKRRMYLIHYIIYLIPTSIRRFEDYRNNQLATLEVRNILL